MSARMQVEGVIFDVDGVLVDSPHERAWRDTLETLMETAWRGIAQRTSYAPERFTTKVYQQEIAGKSREAGARAALLRFGVPGAEHRAAQYAEGKQQALARLIEAGQFGVFPDAIRLLMGAKARGMRVAAASSSKNANQLLARIPIAPIAEHQGARAPTNAPGATLLDRFDVNVSGRGVPRGKPAPDLFLLAAEELGTPPERCLVVEDSPAGVQAAKAAEMKVIGIARLGDQEMLRAAGADQVVTSLDDIDMDALAEGRIARRAA